MFKKFSSLFFAGVFGLSITAVPMTVDFSTLSVTDNAAAAKDHKDKKAKKAKKAQKSKMKDAKDKMEMEASDGGKGKAKGIGKARGKGADKGKGKKRGYGN